MIRPLLLAIAVGLTSGCGPSANKGSLKTLSDLQFASWGELESELRPDTPGTLKAGESVYDQILETDAATTIWADGTPELWQELCKSGSTMVSLLGYRCIAEKVPQWKFQAALHVLSRRKGGSMLIFIQPLQLLNDAKLTEDSSAAFTKFISSPDSEELDLREVTSFLSSEFLSGWAAKADLPTAPAEVQALAVSSAYAASVDHGTPMPESVERAFSSFAESTSDRLAVFVWHAPDSIDKDELVAAITRLLRDDTVSEPMYQAALYQKIDFIKANINPADLNLNARQQARFDEFLKEAAKHAGE